MNSQGRTEHLSAFLWANISKHNTYVAQKDGHFQRLLSMAALLVISLRSAENDTLVQLRMQRKYFFNTTRSAGKLSLNPALCVTLKPHSMVAISVENRSQSVYSCWNVWEGEKKWKKKMEAKECEIRREYVTKKCGGLWGTTDVKEPDKCLGWKECWYPKYGNSDGITNM